MKAPSPPPTPDPYKTAAAQQMANVEVAVANTALQNADEERPDGYVTFEEIPVDIPTNTYDGSGNITGTRNIRRWKKISTLTAKGQTQFEGQQDIAIALNTWALAQVGLLADQQLVPISAGDLTARLSPPDAASIDSSDVQAGDLTLTIGSTDLSAHYDAVRDAIDERIQYQIDLDRTRRITALANMGLVPGMDAYDRDLLAFDKQSTDARTQAYLAAAQEQTRIIQTEQMVAGFKNATVETKFRLDTDEIENRNKRRMMAYQALAVAANFVDDRRNNELQEEIAIRAQNINEISSLMHGGKIDIPQFQSFRAGAIDKTPVAESVYQSAAMDMQKWQVRVQQQQAMMGGLLGLGGNLLGGMFALSDKRVKRGIRKLWDDARGFAWYAWSYVWDRPGVVRVGVLAQEVPHARVMLPGGFTYAVDYGRL